jgi:hypothetical protein
MAPTPSDPFGILKWVLAVFASNKILLFHFYINQRKAVADYAAEKTLVRAPFQL